MLAFHDTSGLVKIKYGIHVLNMLIRSFILTIGLHIWGLLKILRDMSFYDVLGEYIPSIMYRCVIRRTVLMSIP